MTRKGWKTPKEKTCCVCGKTKPAKDFGWKDKKKGYLRSECKACHSERGKKYRAEHADKLKAYNAKYRADHRDELIEYHREYYKNHKKKFYELNKAYVKRNEELVRQKAKEYRDAHREELRQKSAEYYAEHKEELLEKYKENRRYNRRYKKLNKEQQLKLFEENKGLVGHIAKRYKCHEYMYEDMIQAGYVGLWKGIVELDKFKPNKAKLSTWLGWYIQHELQTFTWKAANNSGLSAGVKTIRQVFTERRESGKDPDAEAHRRLVGNAVHIEANVDRHDDDSNSLEGVLGIEDKHYDGLSEALSEVLSHLDDRRRECICRCYGIGRDEEARKDIAKDFGVSVKMVDHLIKTALEQLRELPGTSSLAVYL